jgi:hypothetical protein
VHRLPISTDAEDGWRSRLKWLAGTAWPAPPPAAAPALQLAIRTVRWLGASGDPCALPSELTLELFEQTRGDDGRLARPSSTSRSWAMIWRRPIAR